MGTRWGKDSLQIDKRIKSRNVLNAMGLTEGGKDERVGYLTLRDITRVGLGVFFLRDLAGSVVKAKIQLRLQGMEAPTALA